MADRLSGGDLSGTEKGMRRDGFRHFLLIRERTQLLWFSGIVVFVWVLFFAGFDFANFSKGGVLLLFAIFGPPLFVLESWVRYRRFRKNHLQSDPEEKVE